MLTVGTAKDALRRAGIRVTPQRLMIIDVLVDNCTHPTAEDIYLRVRQQYPSISLATVYHTLTLLSQQGLVLELHGAKEGLRCDPDTTPHAHAYCERCSGVFDIPVPSLQTWHTTALPGFHADKAEISLYGVCGECQAVSAQP